VSAVVADLIDIAQEASRSATTSSKVRADDIVDGPADDRSWAKIRPAMWWSFEPSARP
jgi:hypothetical protein